VNLGSKLLVSSRREFLLGTAAVAFVPNHGDSPAPQRPQRITLAQVEVTNNIKQNVAKARKAFEQAKYDGADWVLFPEGFLSGYYAGFDQEEVSKAFGELALCCREGHVTGLISTCWKECGKAFDQIRIVDTTGKLVGEYAKICLCYGDFEFSPGDFPMVHVVGGIKFGTLICNDLWVTPGFSDGPDPHLSLKQARAGAQVIFHAVYTSPDVRYRSYTESNLLVRAAEAKCPIIVCNAYNCPEIVCPSGVVGSDFKFLETLPLDREVIKTVEFSLPYQEERPATTVPSA
jgi:predicted amidohydrolase